MSEIQFKQWVDDYTEYLLAWALMKISDRGTAEDLVQDTFLAAYRSKDKFKGEASPKTWLVSILKNKIADHYRSAQRKKVQYESSGQMTENEAAFFDKKGHWSPAFYPTEWEKQDKLEENEGFQKVLSFCISGLSTKMAAVIRLKFFEQQDGEDICKELEISSSNYWQLAHRAKLHLRACLEKNWFKVQKG